jgi:hypothetical protein
MSKHAKTPDLETAKKGPRAKMQADLFERTINPPSENPERAENPELYDEMVAQGKRP